MKSFASFKRKEKLEDPPEIIEVQYQQDHSIKRRKKHKEKKKKHQEVLSNSKHSKIEEPAQFLVDSKPDPDNLNFQSVNNAHIPFYKRVSSNILGLPEFYITNK